MDYNEKDVVIILQCHIVKERCGGYFCEHALTFREGSFEKYPADKAIRHINLTCGGCCGRASQRKIANYLHQLKKREDIDRSRVVVHLSTCITQSNHHGPKCPHLDYLKDVISRINVDVVEDSRISHKAQTRREQGIY